LYDAYLPGFLRHHEDNGQGNFHIQILD